MEKEVLDKLNLSKLVYFSIECPKCNTIQRGNHVFCKYCHEKKKKAVRRFTGCRSKKCYANPTVFPDHVFDTFTEKQFDSLLHATCKHKGKTADAVYSLTPVMHIINIMSAGLDDWIINSTEDELVNYIDECSKNDSISSMMCHNLIYCFEAMGKDRIVNQLIGIFKEMKSIENSTTCFYTFVESICKEGSIEHFYFSNH